MFRTRHAKCPYDLPFSSHISSERGWRAFDVQRHRKVRHRACHHERRRFQTVPIIDEKNRRKPHSGPRRQVSVFAMMARSTTFTPWRLIECFHTGILRTLCRRPRSLLPRHHHACSGSSMWSRRPRCRYSRSPQHAARLPKRFHLQLAKATGTDDPASIKFQLTRDFHQQPGQL